MKKLLAVIVSVCCLLSVFCNVKNMDKFVYQADDSDFASNEDYYRNLCQGRNLDQETTLVCAEYRQYKLDQKESLQRDINNLNSQISSIKADILNQGRKVNEINDTIARIETQIEGIEKDIRVIEKNIAEITQQIADRERRIEELNNGIKERMVVLQARVSLNSYIGFIMGANNFVDLLRRISAINEFTDYDVSKIREMEEEKAKLEEDKIALQAQKDEQVKKRAELEDYKADMYVLRQQAEELIAEFRRKQAELQQGLDNIQTNMDELDKRIEVIEDALSGYYPSAGLIRPIDNFWVSSGCFYYSPGNPYSGFHPAADMATPLGNDLHAIANGYVVATRGGCGYGYIGSNCNGGFGNYIVYMIEVGGTCYFVINAHLSAIYVSVGDVIHQGQETLGLTGSSGSSSGPHLHVEIIRFGNMDIKDAVREYRRVGQIYYTLGRNINWSCAYRGGAPCYENALEKLGLVYGGSY